MLLVALLILLPIAFGLSWWGRARRVRPRWLTWLPFGAPLACLAGGLGTVSGLIASFDAVGTASPAEKQRQLAEGISSAMKYTAVGLLAALIILVAAAVAIALARRDDQGSRDTTVS